VPSISDTPGYDRLYQQATQAALSRDLPRAIALCNEAIACDPSRAEAYYKRGNAQKDLNLSAEAIASYNEAIARKPDYAFAYCNRGVVEQHLGRLEDALRSFDAAIGIDPTDSLTHYNRALLLQDLSRWEEAVSAYDRSIAARPDFADALYNRAITQLYLGRFEEGWRHYESRWVSGARHIIGEQRRFDQPQWLGQQPLAGARLLVYSEQGLGDAIQFCRYATLCAARGATVILEVPAPLVAVLATLQGVTTIVPRGAALPSFDLHCAMMSLPLAFQTTLATIPASRPYLRNDPAVVTRWQFRLGERVRPRIGLAWSGNPANPHDGRRSIPLAQLLDCLPQGCDYYALQTQVLARDEQVLDDADALFTLDLQDFADTAAVAQLMDVVVSVDTSVLHLCGALGLNPLALIYEPSDWRWLRGRSDSPWYPGMSLYRQAAAGDWTGVLQRLSTELHQRFNQT
jgi:Tetratricopeptide repeat